MKQSARVRVPNAYGASKRRTTIPSQSYALARSRKYLGSVFYTKTKHRQLLTLLDMVVGISGLTFGSVYYWPNKQTLCTKPQQADCVGPAVNTIPTQQKPREKSSWENLGKQLKSKDFQTQWTDSVLTSFNCKSKQLVNMGTKLHNMDIEAIMVTLNHYQVDGTNDVYILLIENGVNKKTLQISAIRDKSSQCPQHNHLPTNSPKPMYDREAL